MFFWNLIKISLRSVPNGVIDNTLAMVLIMTWRRTTDKQLHYSDVTMNAMNGEFPAQGASNAENVSIGSCHRDLKQWWPCLLTCLSFYRPNYSHAITWTKIDVSPMKRPWTHPNEISPRVDGVYLSNTVTVNMTELSGLRKGRKSEVTIFIFFRIKAVRVTER